ncbi:NAD(P)/FAD-dependent oxidoreductase [Anaplasmataceae bacterium AB001_6]|nr:NAD(P)/FAD-dependent oxidoreductase [Anaplasmataceae bacterium AB001_6]
MANENVSDITIIGAGPVGLFTIFQAGTLGMKCNVIDSLDILGGQCSFLYPDKYIYDIPAFPKIKALELINALYKQCKVFNPNVYLSQTVLSIEKKNNCFLVKTSKTEEILSKKIILAIGAGNFEHNKIPIEDEHLHNGKSILYSIDKIDRFTNKRVAILGGGDAAVDWALNLAEKAKEIYFVHRRNKLRCLPESQQKLENLVQKGLIKPLIPYKIVKINSNQNGNISSADFESIGLIDNTKIETIDLDYILPFFGLKQNLSTVAKWNISVANGTIPVEFSNCETNIEGIYAVGDIASYNGKLKLILSGFSETAMACNHIFKNLYSNKPFNWEYSTSKSHIFETKIGT